jgi:hypothetical protein
MRGTVAATAALAVASIPSRGKAAATPTLNPPKDEHPDVFEVLTLWVALTNPQLPRPLKPDDAATLKYLAEVTMLPNGAYLKAAYNRAAQNPNIYDPIVAEFKTFEKLVNYNPGECPKSIDTLNQIAQQTPPHA